LIFGRLLTNNLGIFMLQLNSWLIYLCGFSVLFGIHKRTFRGFVLDVLGSLLACRELNEEVGEAWVGEESLLSLLAVFIHGISH
jgi:hypothetical protein